MAQIPFIEIVGPIGEARYHFRSDIVLFGQSSLPTHVVDTLALDSILSTA